MIRNTIGTRRCLMHITQREFGEKFGVSAAAVSAWEIGRTEPGVAAIKKMCKIFNCSFDELFYEEDDT